MSADSPVFILCIALLVAALSVAARRLNVASPILMLLAGALVAYLPFVPQVTINPELVLLLLLPPLLYTSGVGMSWRGFRANLRPILMLSIGCVLFTAAIVAAAAHYLLGVSWPIGFVLGAIVSPPDAVAPMAILRAMRLPVRLVTVLEGESLVNDATALVTLSFALGAVGSAPFSLPRALLAFLAIVGAELAYGLCVGLVLLRLRHVVRDARAEVLLALATPFIAFWPPHAAGGSGVISCVAAGLYVSWNGRGLIRPATRLQGYFIWDLVVWGIEALVFLLAGLQARAVVEALQDEGWQRAITAGLLTSGVVIGVRYIWVYLASYLPSVLFPATCGRDRPADWRSPFLIAFTGLRGAVSLLAALLIPPMVGGLPFPDRDLVLFTTYCVLFVTLVGLGSALPAVVRALGLDRAGAEEARRYREDERRVRTEALDEVLQAIPVASGPESELAQLGIRRASVTRAFLEGRLTDEARRRIEREMDLDEARLLHAIEGERAL